MRDLERKLDKLEHLKSFNREEVTRLVDEEDLHPLERIGILAKLGLLDGETIVGWIVEGSKH